MIKFYRTFRAFFGLNATKNSLIFSNWNKRVRRIFMWKILVFWKAIFSKFFLNSEQKSSRSLAVLLLAGLWKLLCVCPKELFKGFFQKFVSGCLSFGDDEFRIFGKKIRADLLKTHSTCLGELFVENFFFKHLWVSQAFSDFEPSFRTSGGKKSTEMAELHSPCPEESFDIFCLWNFSVYILPVIDWQN